MAVAVVLQRAGDALAQRAALLKEKDRMAGKAVGLMATGGNIDQPLYLEVLGEGEDSAAKGDKAA